MPYDPNWFYSSLAQCAAAVVGLLGAVLATRLQQQMVEVRSSFADVAKLLEALRESLRSRMSEIRNFATFADERIRQIEAALEVGQTTLQVTEEVYFWGASGSGSPWSISVDKAVLTEYRNLRALADPTIAALERHAVLSTVDDARSADQCLANLQTTLPSAVAQGVIPGLRTLVISIETANAAHLRSASIQLPAVFVTVLGWLCIFGLVGPLAFLSAFDNSSKWILLATFSLGVIAIPAYIAYEVLRIAKLKCVVASSAERSGREVTKEQAKARSKS